MRSHQYDLVLNGIELASGSIRNHNGDMQRKILGLMGFDATEQQRQFGLLLSTFDFGAPPHGGFGMGLDRLTALLCGEDSIREVIRVPEDAKRNRPAVRGPRPGQGQAAQGAAHQARPPAGAGRRGDRRQKLDFNLTYSHFFPGDEV